MSTTLISGGTVVTAAGTLDADVLVAGEKIAAVLARDVTGTATEGSESAAAVAADRVIDATGKYVLPGLKSDPPASQRTPALPGLRSEERATREGDA